MGFGIFCFAIPAIFFSLAVAVGLGRWGWAESQRHSGRYKLASWIAPSGVLGCFVLTVLRYMDVVGQPEVLLSVFVMLLGFVVSVVVNIVLRLVPPRVQ